MLKKLTLILFLFSLVGCTHTVEGVGEDIEKMGKSIKDSVKGSDSEKGKD